MKINLDIQRAGAAKLTLEPAESFYIRQQSLLAMTARGHVHVDEMPHGICRLVNRDGINDFWLAGQLSGEARIVELKNQLILVQQDVFLGASADLTVETASSSLPVSTYGWFKVSGYGVLILSALGSIYPLQVDSEYIVNTAYIVAYSSELKHEEISSEPDDGEMNATSATYKFFGRGFVWCHTHRPHVLGALLSPQLKKLKA